MFAIMSLASGGTIKADSLKQKVSSQIQKTTMSTTLAGFYIVALEHIKPECLGPNPVEFEQAEHWDEVLVNGYGVELSRIPHSRTYHYTVAQRHEHMFRQIGTPANIETVKFLSAILKGLGMIPDDTHSVIETLSTNLRDLRMAMDNYECNSEVLKKIEEALMKKAAGK